MEWKAFISTLEIALRNLAEYGFRNKNVLGRGRMTRVEKFFAKWR